MSRVSADNFTKEDLIRETEMNLWNTWSNFGRAPGCTLHDEGDALWFETPIPIIPYNTVLKFQVDQDIDQRIDRLLAHLHQRQVPILWIVHPSSRPSDLAQRLKDRGLIHIEDAPGMVRRLVDLPPPPPLPTDIEIREAVTSDDIFEFNELAAWRWEVPAPYHSRLQEILHYFQHGGLDGRTRFWLAWRSGAPISKAASYCAGRSAGIYAVATKPEARGLGIASALAIEAMRMAQLAGKELAVLHATPKAEKLYARLGFQTVAPFHLFASQEIYI